LVRERTRRIEEGAAEAEAFVEIAGAQELFGQLIPVVMPGLCPGIHRERAARRKPAFSFLELQ